MPSCQVRGLRQTPTDSMVLRTLEWTYVLYEDTLVDKACAFLNFVPFVIIFGLLTQMASRRCCESWFLLTGLLLSTMLNGIVKNIVQQPRPPTSYRHDFGMPSDHSQFMAFFALYVVNWVWSGRVKWHHQAHLKPALALLVPCLSATVMYSRVRSGVHSVEQVLIGCSIGLAFGMIWTVLARTLVRPKLYPWLCASTLGRFLLATDYGCLDDPLLLMHIMALESTGSDRTALQSRSVTPESFGRAARAAVRAFEAELQTADTPHATPKEE